VADGFAGDYVARYIVDTLPRKFEKELNKTSSIKEAFNVVLKKIENHAIQYLVGGSTIVAAYIDPNKTLHLISIGNSRAALGGLNDACFSTLDHVPINPCEEERIKKNDGTIFRFKPSDADTTDEWKINYSKISRMIGGRDLKEKGNGKQITLKSKMINSKLLYVQLRDLTVYNRLEVNINENQIISDEEYIQITRPSLIGRWLVLATDGLWSAFSTKEETAENVTPKDRFTRKMRLDLKLVFEFIKRYENLSASEIAKKLVQEAKYRGSTDNIAVILVDLLSPIS
jgi:serine/threonine protein phosphatase PrpC